ncbi:MAG: DNA primase [Isosphaeraceae bacterium]
MPRHPDSSLSAIKSAVDIVSLVGDYLPGTLRRVGSKFKALCPFHDDHNPSLELNPERQSFKCWSCGAGGDIFDFVKNYEHVDFPEAMRMLADRAGIVLERQPAATASPRGPSKSELYEVNSWAEGTFAGALGESAEATGYLEGRGLSRMSVERFRLGYAPEARGWLLGLAQRQGYNMDVLEHAGLVARAEGTGPVRERFRGRVMFPIHDDRGRAVGFGGRILPRVERAMSEQGRHVAKYLNTAETALFRKRNLLYGADLARAAARRAGWVAVVEGYTDVIAAHQVGLENVVGTLGTALGAEHIAGLRRLADRVVLVFDGDEAGMSAADRSLELFLGHEVDLRVLTLPAGLDPCDFLLKEGASAFGDLADAAPEPPAYLIDRAATKFDVQTSEGARRAAEWVLAVLGSAPANHRLGVDVKVDRVLDQLAHRLRVSKDSLHRMRQQLKRPPARKAAAAPPAVAGPAAPADAPAFAPVRPSDLDPTDLELLRIVLNEPGAVAVMQPRLPVSALRDDPLREILQVCYDLHDEGLEPDYQELMTRLEDPALRALATDLVASSTLVNPEPARLPDNLQPAPWREQLERMLEVLDGRERHARREELRKALAAVDRQADPDAYRAIELEYRRLLTSGRTRRS